MNADSNTLGRSSADEFRHAVVRARVRYALASALGVAVALGLIVVAVEVPGFTDAIVLAAIAALVFGSIAGRYAIEVVVPPELSRLASGVRMEATITSIRAFAPAIGLRVGDRSEEVMRRAVRLEVAAPTGTRELTVIGFVPFESVERLKVGARVDVAVDREDESAATIDWSTLR